MIEFYSATLTAPDSTTTSSSSHLEQSARHTRDMHGEVFNFFSGRFLNRIRPKWLGFKTRDAASTKLPAKYQRMIERLPWVAGWKKDIEKRSGVKAKIKQKVSLCALCTLA